jgi:hypothetical protein
MAEMHNDHITRSLAKANQQSRGTMHMYEGAVVLQFFLD